MATFHSNNSFLKNTQVTKFYLDVNTLPKIPQSASTNSILLKVDMTKDGSF